VGRKRHRKRERRQAQRSLPGAIAAFEPEEAFAVADSDFGFMLLGERKNQRTGALTCATCHEFVEDGELGRGTCLHPGSGVLSPWHDTGACQFHTRIRR
jgi:hypothetical protein